MEKRTLEILKNFAGINSRILIREGNDLRIKNEDSSIFGIANLSDSFTKEHAIYDLNEFLSTLSLFENPEIEYKEDHMVLSNGPRKVKYNYANVSTVAPVPQGELKFPAPQIQFKLTKASLENAMRASSVLRLSDLVITSDGAKILNMDSKGGNEYTCEIEELVFSDDGIDQQFVIGFSDLNLIPDTYTVRLTEKAAQFVAESGDLLYIVMYKVV